MPTRTRAIGEGHCNMMAVVAEVWGSKEGVDRVAGARESTRLPSVAAVVLQEASIGTWGSLHEKG